MRKATAFFLAILMIALTACTGNTKMPVESGVSDSMTIGGTDDMLGTTPPIRRNRNDLSHTKHEPCGIGLYIRGSG